MKVFDKAVVKLTAAYTLVLLALSVGFSVAFYAVIDTQLNRPFQPRPGMAREVLPDGNSDFRVMMDQRDEKVRTNLVFSLISINTTVLLLGAVASYLLARLTLKPINEAFEAQSRFVQDASHELRTPLAAIAMENEVLLRDGSAGKKELVAQVSSNLEEIQKLQKLANTLLSLDGTQPLKVYKLDLKITGENARKKCTKSASEKHISIDVTATGELMANKEVLEQLLVILIENAIKYSPAGTTITVDGQDGQIWVSDEGPGVAPEDLPHIFERFYRGEKSRTSTGYGLGLPLAQHLASQMSMRVTASNNSKCGATFRVSC
ncbi:MAG: HAMP domain-containing histidine kinase [Candidatus Nomurabacteria bacterium]|jgi:signal transduction histidine kinase|nr:HAMP domain-containing histidine kinase [Candidatus Nomurabacteria bacterium]